MPSIKSSRLIIILAAFLVAILSTAPVYGENNVRLTTIRGGRHKAYASIVFVFSDTVTATRPVIDKNEIIFSFKRTTTSLKLYRRYKTFDSYVDIKESDNQLNVRIGIPEKFIRFSSFNMNTPDRYVVNLYIEKADLPPTAQKAPDKAPEPVGAVPLPDPVPKKAEPPQTVTPPLEPAKDLRQMERIEAKILSRKGLHEKSLEIYHRLRKQYPDDTEIWEEYIEIMVEASLFEAAQVEIQKLLQEDPDNIRAKRIQSTIYMKLRQYTWTFQVFDQLLSLYRVDPGIWSDYAFARLDAQEWSSALNYFSRVLELEPENKEALRGVHEILREHRPRLDAGYFHNNQEAGEADTKTIFGRYSQHLTEKSYIDLNYDILNVDRSPSPGFLPIDEDVSSGFIRLRHQFNQRWQARFGGGGYTGLGDGTTLLLGGDYSPRTNLVFRADFIGKRPWFDPVDAAAFDGAYNQLAASIDWNFSPAFGVFIGGELWDYFVDSDEEYGQKRTFVAILTKRFLQRPALSINYAYYYADFDFEDENVKPIPMIPTEGVHSFALMFEHKPCTYWSYGISGGPRWDVIRNVNSWYVLPIIKVRFGNRIESFLSYEFNTEANTADGGESQILRLWTRIVF
jgi:tetratricopeptide (TPR) repeat protein